MTDANIKQLIERLRQRSNSRHMLLTDPPKPAPDADCHAAADMLEQYLATKQEYSDFRQLVSDTVEGFNKRWATATLRQPDWGALLGFIIPAPKPDPLVEVIEKCAGRTYPTTEDAAKEFRAALDARGLEIKEKGQ